MTLEQKKEILESEIKPKKDHYLFSEEDDFGDEYCHGVGCSACFGTKPESYEPNGYGCDDREKFEEKYAHLVMDHEEAYEFVLKQLEAEKAKVEKLKMAIRMLIESCEDECRGDEDCDHCFAIGTLKEIEG